MSLTITYSHAAPVIRRQIVSHLGMAETNPTQRDKARERHIAEGLTEALSFLLRAVSTRGEPNGIAERETLGETYLAIAQDSLGDRWALLGFDEDEEVPS